MTDFEELKKLREEINQLLKDRPELVEYQREIEEALRKAGTNPNNRMSAIQGLFADQKKKLNKAFKDLKIELNKLVEAKNKLANIKKSLH